MRKVKYLVNNNPKDPYSWVAAYNDEGRLISVVYGDNPKNKYSWTAT